MPRRQADWFPSAIWGRTVTVLKKAPSPRRAWWRPIGGLRTQENSGSKVNT